MRRPTKCAAPLPTCAGRQRARRVPVAAVRLTSSGKPSGSLAPRVRRNRSARSAIWSSRRANSPDAERRIANNLGSTGPGEQGQDRARRLAGRQDGLAERTRRLQEGLKAGPKPAAGSPGRPAASGEAARVIEQQRLVERMQQSAAEGIRASAGRRASLDDRPKSDEQRAVARALDKAADTLASASEGGDEEARKLSAQLSRTRDLRERLDGLGDRLEEQGGPNGRTGSPSPGVQKAASESRKSGESLRGEGSRGGDPGKLRDEYAQQLQEARELLSELSRENPNSTQPGAGATPLGQGAVLSAPGTEAFKQDFARWEQMRRQATTALELAEASISKQLRAAQARDRLAAGVADTAPAEYQQQVDSYFKAIAGKKK